MSHQQNTTVRYSLVEVVVGNDRNRYDGDEHEREDTLAFGSSVEEVVSTIDFPVSEELPIWAKEEPGNGLRREVHRLQGFSDGLSELIQAYEAGERPLDSDYAVALEWQKKVAIDLEEAESQLALSPTLSAAEQAEAEEHSWCFYAKPHSYYEVRRLEGDSYVTAQKLYSSECGWEWV